VSAAWLMVLAYAACIGAVVWGVMRFEGTDE
jgi:hypothetical protein